MSQPAMTDYLSLNGDQPVAIHSRTRRILQLLAPHALVTVAVASLLLAVPSPLSDRTNIAGQSEWAFLHAKRLRSGPMAFECNCPPSEAMWMCSQDEHESFLNGTSCEFYRQPGQGASRDVAVKDRTAAGAGLEDRSCPACASVEETLDCRSCLLGMSTQGFCNACMLQGLSDVGCPECSAAATQTEVKLIGGAVDSHGCRPSAGYTWCEANSSCIRPWEHGIHSETEFLASCSGRAALLGTDAGTHGCRPSAGYSWCDASSSCIRPWEQGIHSELEFAARCSKKAGKAKPVSLTGGDVDKHGCIGSAGYDWCEATSSCIRPWEHGIHSQNDFKAKCSAAELYAEQEP